MVLKTLTVLSTACSIMLIRRVSKNFKYAFFVRTKNKGQKKMCPVHSFFNIQWKPDFQTFKENGNWSTVKRT